MEALGRYGRKLGLAFQIADDLLDVEASGEAVRRTARELAETATLELEGFGPDAEDLRKLAEFVHERNY